MPVPKSDIFDLIQEDMARGEASLRDVLDRAFFVPSEFLKRLPPPTWRDRLRRRLASVRGYFVTLGKALRGDHPYDWDD